MELRLKGDRIERESCLSTMIHRYLFIEFLVLRCKPPFYCLGVANLIGKRKIMHMKHNN